jgi:ubiquinone/menaquinone biosynthesis C-methylase UbiE
MDSSAGKKSVNSADNCSAPTEKMVHEHHSHAMSGPHNGIQFAERLYAWESLVPSANTNRGEPTPEPYSLKWFLGIEQQRLSRHGQWIPRLLEFAKHSGDTLLGMGAGLGTDWLQYARHGASVVVCSRSWSQLALVRRNFELRGLPGRFLHARPDCLPLESASIDVACVSGLFEELDNWEMAVDEIYRVLKPGGKVLAVVSARYDIRFWYLTCYPWLRLFNRHDISREGPSFGARQLKRLFGKFAEHRVHKRHLSRADVPHVWRWLPRPALERIMGKALILKAFKPLSAAMALQIAA